MDERAHWDSQYEEQDLEIQSSLRLLNILLEGLKFRWTARIRVFSDI
jgi:hypothetical protein